MNKKYRLRQVTENFVKRLRRMLLIYYEKKYGNTVFDDTFFKKKEWIWISILLIGTLLIFGALFVDMNKIDIKRWISIQSGTMIRHILWQASETICGTIVTYSTMLVAIVIFFYSVIDNKRLGIPYRRLIAYTIGSHTIPVLFMTTLLLTIFMLIALYVPLKHTVYVCIIYIFMIQIFVIIEILLSTSYKHCKRVICQIERKRYIFGMSFEEEFNTEWAYFFGHLEHAIHSEEFIPDKRELLIDFLWIPFYRRSGKLYKVKVDGKKMTKTEILERIYQFYFVNILSAFQNFNGEEKHLERNQLYRCIRDFVLELSDKLDIKNDDVMKSIYNMVLSGILNGLISSNVEDNVEFCDFILSRCISNNEISRRQACLFMLFYEMLSLFQAQTDYKSLRMTNYKKWEPINEEDVTLYAVFWDIWTKIYDFSFMEKAEHFERAIQTMSGRSNASAIICGMLLDITE